MTPMTAETSVGGAHVVLIAYEGNERWHSRCRVCLVLLVAVLVLECNDKYLWNDLYIHLLIAIVLF